MILAEKKQLLLKSVNQKEIDWDEQGQRTKTRNAEIKKEKEEPGEFEVLLSRWCIKEEKRLGK